MSATMLELRSLMMPIGVQMLDADAQPAEK
jgi:hypothetical protein